MVNDQFICGLSFDFTIAKKANHSEGFGSGVGGVIERPH
jgi:hypothetical protein